MCKKPKPGAGDVGPRERCIVDDGYGASFTQSPQRAQGAAPAITEIAASNSLADLAGRIVIEHQAVSTALKDGVRHAITAGELLIEAKAQLQHGQWLPWLGQHCTISERTAQLYMRCARNRTAIEEQIRNGDADLSLNEAAAMLMLSSDVRKLLAFSRDCENLSGEELIERCVAEGVAVIQDPTYNPFAGRSETEIVEWHLFVMFLSLDLDVGRDGGEPEKVWPHVEWILQRPFQNVAEWLGEEGEKFRRVNGWGAVPDGFRAAWAAFLAENRDRTLTDICDDLAALQKKCVEAIADGRVFVNGRAPRRKRPRS